MSESHSRKPWLARSTSRKRSVGHMTIRQALANPKVLALAAAYFFVVTGSYGVEFYMASIVKDWYKHRHPEDRLLDRHPGDRVRSSASA